MKLNLKQLEQPDIWATFQLPHFDITAMRAKTAKSPVWVHFGAGNIFRAFPAVLQQKLLDKGLADTGIIVCEGFDGEIIHRAFAPFNNLCVAVTLKSDGSTEKTVVASVAEAFAAAEGKERLKEIFASPSLQMVSFTITEKGYSITSDENSTPGIVASLCLHRYLNGAAPLALVSMDNCSQNGDKLKACVLSFSERWVEQGLCDKGFISYLENKISFPWSMIDKITPRPSESVRDMLIVEDYEDAEIICTDKNTYTASFVNAEESQYLIIEDSFPNGRPPLHEAGVIFTDRGTVERAEKMKVGTCLNPLHTVLAVFGCLLGYDSISAEMKDPMLVKLITNLAEKESLPVVTHPGIIDPVGFYKEAVGKRFPNPFVPDTPQRIACDTSQKIPPRFGGTLKAYEAAGKSMEELVYIPFFVAGWLRYLLGTDDMGKAFAISPDPMAEAVRARLKGIKLGDKGPFDAVLVPILSDKNLFGIDLCEHGLHKKVCDYFTAMTAGAGAVRLQLGHSL